MNGPHDLGGMHGLGSVRPESEAEEPVFHGDWERRAFAVTLACSMLGRWNLDESRFARERQHPIDYLRNSYYENWLAGLEKLLVEKGLVNEEELAGALAPVPSADAVAVDAGKTREIISTGGPTRMVSDKAPRFQVGDTVAVVNDHPLTHTRAPRYARGHVGTIECLHGVHVFADENAKGNRVGEHLYSVRFEGNVLWGDGHEARDAVYIDLWEPHLEQA